MQYRPVASRTTEELLLNGYTALGLSAHPLERSGYSLVWAITNNNAIIIHLRGFVCFINYVYYLILEKERMHKWGRR